MPNPVAIGKLLSSRNGEVLRACRVLGKTGESKGESIEIVESRKIAYLGSTGGSLA
jgi:hypothetical protein